MDVYVLHYTATSDNCSKLYHSVNVYSKHSTAMTTLEIEWLRAMIDSFCTPDDDNFMDSTRAVCKHNGITETWRVLKRELK